MRSILQLFLFLLSWTLSAQNPDSLWSVFNTPDSSVQARLSSIHRLTRTFMYNNPDSAMRLAEQEYAFAEAQGDSAFMASALNLQGGIHSVKNEFIEALDKFYRMLDIRLAIQDTVGTGTAYNNIGNIYFYKSDYPKALEYYIRSLHYEQMKSTPEGLATSYINIGSIYALQEEFLKALDYFKRALKLYEDHRDVSGTASCYANIGNIYKSLDSVDISHVYFLKSVPLMEQVKDEYNLAIVYGNLADTYRLRGQVDSMYDYYHRSEMIRETLGDKLGLARLYVNRGQAQVALKDYRRAIRDCERGLALAEPFSSFSEMRNACDCLYQAYKALGQNEDALKAFEQANKLEDSLAKDETRMQLRIMEFREQAARDSLQREEEKVVLATLHADEVRRESRQGNLFLGIAVALLLIAGALFLLVRKVRRSRADIQEAKDRSDSLLLSILPAEVTKELLEKGKVVAREFDNVSVLFTDFAGFTLTSESMRPQEMLKELNVIYNKFDEITVRHNIRKIKSIGDAYMAAGGLPLSSRETMRQTVLAALDMQEFIETYSREREAEGKPGFHMRAGIHTGQVIAGIVGFQNFQYDIWGDSVNLASRMERYGNPGKVNISKDVYDIVKDDPIFIFEARGPISVKGKGEMEMWFVSRAESVRM